MSVDLEGDKTTTTTTTDENTSMDEVEPEMTETYSDEKNETQWQTGSPNDLCKEENLITIKESNEEDDEEMNEDDLLESLAKSRVEELKKKKEEEEDNEETGINETKQ